MAMRSLAVAFVLMILPTMSAIGSDFQDCLDQATQRFYDLEQFCSSAYENDNPGYIDCRDKARQDEASERRSCFAEEQAFQGVEVPNIAATQSEGSECIKGEGGCGRDASTQQCLAGCEISHNHCVAISNGDADQLSQCSERAGTCVSGC
jgi:hypothetical protein